VVLVFFALVIASIQVYIWNIRVCRQKLARYRFFHRTSVFDPSQVPQKEVTHSFVVSLTTSPTRLPNIVPILENIPWNQIDALILNVPEKFRNQEP
jgi:hypothetical protein